MTDYVKVEDHKGLIRDMQSKALLIIDQTALIHHRNKKKLLQEMINNTTKIKKLENDIDEIKEMLKILIKTSKV